MKRGVSEWDGEWDPLRLQRVGRPPTDAGDGALQRSSPLCLPLVLLLLWLLMLLLLRLLQALLDLVLLYMILAFPSARFLPEMNKSMMCYFQPLHPLMMLLLLEEAVLLLLLLRYLQRLQRLLDLERTSVKLSPFFLCLFCSDHRLWHCMRDQLLLLLR